MSEENYKEELSESGTVTGIEADEEDEEIILEPFDPEAISIEQKVVAMDTLIRRLKQKSIHLSPSFQRSEVWDTTRRSRLIESIMLRIPLPMFYVAANESGQWEVVDGLQRLSTIRNFILGDNNGVKLKLKNLEFLGGKFNGKTYDGIENDESQQRVINTIRETEMRFTVINPGTPEAVKRNIFKRINTGGMPLTGQEIRHALYQGKASELLEKLVTVKEFKLAIDGKINDSRMAARELILRFLSFQVFSRADFKTSMDNWLSNTMRVINCMPELENNKLQRIYLNDPIPSILINDIEKLTDNFVKAMIRARLLFGEHAFRKSLPSYRKAPINKALFESWSNILCQLEDSQFYVLLKHKDGLFNIYEDLLYTAHFNNAISRNSSQPKEVNERYNDINEIVNNIIEGASI